MLKHPVRMLKISGTRVRMSGTNLKNPVHVLKYLVRIKLCGIRYNIQYTLKYAARVKISGNVLNMRHTLKYPVHMLKYPGHTLKIRYAC